MTARVNPILGIKFVNPQGRSDYYTLLVSPDLGAEPLRVVVKDRKELPGDRYRCSTCATSKCQHTKYIAAHVASGAEPTPKQPVVVGADTPLCVHCGWVELDDKGPTHSPERHAFEAEGAVVEEEAPAGQVEATGKVLDLMEALKASLAQRVSA